MTVVPLQDADDEDDLDDNEEPLVELPDALLMEGSLLEDPL